MTWQCVLRVNRMSLQSLGALLCFSTALSHAIECGILNGIAQSLSDIVPSLKGPRSST